MLGKNSSRQNRGTRTTTNKRTSAPAKPKALPTLRSKANKKANIHTTTITTTTPVPNVQFPILGTKGMNNNTTPHRRISLAPAASAAFRPTTTTQHRGHSENHHSPGDKFGDTWTRQAKALGYPSRAVFKLIQAQKKLKLLNPGDVVVDLGCSPGSWSKLSSTIVGGNGFVLGMDLTTLSPQEQLSIGVRQGDVNRRFQYPKSYDDGATTGGLLASERKLLKSRAPVGYMQQDVTEWSPGPGFEHQVDVILSDMAPNTTGITSVDSSNSIDLCYSVVELCSQLFKPPSTKVEQLSGPAERQRALQKLKSDPNHENVLIDHLTQQFNKNMEKRYGSAASPSNTTTTMSDDSDVDDSDDQLTTHISSDTNNEKTSKYVTSSSDVNGKAVLQHANPRINLKMIKRTLKQHVYLQKPNAIGIAETDEASAIYKTNERTLSQIKGNEHISTTWRGTLMMKVFQGEGITDLMNILKQIFVSTYTFKPESSRSESVEIFIICKGYCGPFDHTRITNKHIRRPKTDEYLRSYVSNNRKRPQVPHDPTKSHRYHIGFTPDSPMSQPVAYDERALADKSNPKRKLSLEELYSQATNGAASKFTSDGFKDQEEEKRNHEAHVDQIQRTIASGVTTNVHSAIKNTASLEQGARSPLQREISESDDMLVFRREQFDQLYNRDRVINQVPDTDALIKSMSLFWDEGINFAKKMSIESQTPPRIDVFQSKATFTDQIKQDEVSSILDDLSAPPSNSVTAASLIKEHQRLKRNGGRGRRGDDDNNPIIANLKKKGTKAVLDKDGDNDIGIDELLMDNEEGGEDVIPAVVVAPKKKRGKQSAVVEAPTPPIIDEVEPAIKIKKTRAKKTPATAAIVVKEEEEEESEIVPPVVVKKAAGRKSATKAATTTPAVVEAEVVVEPVTPKTKGRAKKSMVVEQSEPIVETTITPSKTTKGRAKKVVVAAAVETAVVAEPTIIATTTKTTKGRSKKVIVEAAPPAPVEESPVVTKTTKTKGRVSKKAASVVSTTPIIDEPTTTTTPPTTTTATKTRSRTTKAVVAPDEVVDAAIGIVAPKKRGRPPAAPKM